MVFDGLSIELLFFLFSVATVAGFLDVLAGGGGLLTLPALMMSGMPPLSALGTNKLQGCMGTATATYMMLKKKKVSWHDIKYLMLTAFIGSVFGTVIVLFINVEILSFVMPVVLLFIAVYFLLMPKQSEIKQKPKISKWKYQNVIVPAIGYYDGMFGPGAGSFFSLSGVLFWGHGLISSVAAAKPLNFSTNIASLIVFLIADHVVWVMGISMMAGQVIGAWLGSHCLFKVKPEYLRVIIVIMCLAMLVKYGVSMGWF